MTYDPEDPAGLSIFSKDKETKRKVREYWDMRSRGYNLVTLLSLHDTEKYDLLINSLVPKGRKARICDVGTSCGFMAIVAARLGHEVHAIDNSEQMIEKASNNVRNSTLDVHFYVMDAEEPDFPDEYFDLLIFKSTVWSFTEPTRTMSRWMSKLRPGGHILIIDGNYYLSNYDSDYARRQHLQELKDSENRSDHGITNMDHVDFNIIREISKDLPVCAMRRPGWDLNLLFGLGYDNIFVNLDEKEHYLFLTRSGYMVLPVTFVVTARKPPVGSEPLKYHDTRFDDSKLSISEQEVNASVFKAMSDPNRLLILRYLLREKSNVKELAQLTGQSPALVSHNLKLLLSANLVVSTKIGKEVHYFVKDPRKVQELLYYSSF